MFLGKNDTVKKRLLYILLIKIKILERISDTLCLREAMLKPQELCLCPAIKRVQKCKPKTSQHSTSHENMRFKNTTIVAVFFLREIE